MTTSETIINVAGLSFEYPGLRALDNVGFQIKTGSITALVGPNGAGKTTLLRCMSGLQRPLSGRIEINGVNVVEEPRHSHRSIGYLSDFFGLYEELSVRQSLTYVASANGIKPNERDQAVRTTAVELGLETRLDQRTGSLSRGLRQRVAIAQAVIHHPAVILLDEPAAGLDPEARYALGELFVQLRSRGMTLVVSSHILAELEAYSTDMLIVRNGQVIQHKTIAGQPTEQLELEIQVANNADAVRAGLADDRRVTAIIGDNNALRFRFEGSLEDRAELLAKLVGDGHAVSHFAVVATDLQQSYLRTIAARDANVDRHGEPS